MRLIYSPDAIKDLDGLQTSIAERIHGKLQWYSIQEDPLAFAKALYGKAQGFYRFRIGDYRAIFSIQKGSLVLLVVKAIKHRRESYQ